MPESANNAEPRDAGASLIVRLQVAERLPAKLVPSGAGPHLLRLTRRGALRVHETPMGKAYLVENRAELEAYANEAYPNGLYREFSATERAQAALELPQLPLTEKNTFLVAEPGEPAAIRSGSKLILEVTAEPVICQRAEWVADLPETGIDPYPVPVPPPMHEFEGLPRVAVLSGHAAAIEWPGGQLPWVLCDWTSAGMLFAERMIDQLGRARIWAPADVPSALRRYGDPDTPPETPLAGTEDIVAEMRQHSAGLSVHTYLRHRLKEAKCRKPK